MFCCVKGSTRGSGSGGEPVDGEAFVNKLVGMLWSIATFLSAKSDSSVCVSTDRGAGTSGLVVGVGAA